MLSHINIGTGKEISIYGLSELIKGVVGFSGQMIFDTSKPDGPPRKLVDSSRISSLGWETNTDLLDGITKTYDWFKKNANE